MGGGLRAGAAQGAWHVRCTAGQVLVMVQVSCLTTGRPLPHAQVNDKFIRGMAEPATTARELRAFTAAVSAAAAAAGYRVSTVRVQYHSGVSNAAPYDAPILELPAAPEAGQGEGEAETEEQAAAVAAAAGPGYIHDSLCELRFRISPTAFFQVRHSVGGQGATL